MISDILELTESTLLNFTFLLQVGYNLRSYDLEAFRVLFQFVTIVFVAANFVILVKQRNKSYEANILPVNFNFHLPIKEGLSIRSFTKKPNSILDEKKMYAVKYKFDNIGQGVARDIIIKESYLFNFSELIDYIFGKLRDLGYDHKYNINDQRFKFEEDPSNPLSTRDYILFNKTREHAFDYHLTVKDSEVSMNVPVSKAFLFLIMSSLYLFSRIRDKRKEFGYADRTYYNMEKDIWNHLRNILLVNFTISFKDNLERTNKSRFRMQLGRIPVVKEINDMTWVSVKMERTRVEK